MKNFDIQVTGVRGFTRITHIPTGLYTVSDDFHSYWENREAAWKEMQLKLQTHTDYTKQLELFDGTN